MTTAKIDKRDGVRSMDIPTIDRVFAMEESLASQSGFTAQGLAASNVEEKVARLDPARRRKVEAPAAELTTEEKSLRELRRAGRLTQAHLASELGISQDSNSRLEQRSDLLLSTLRKTVEAMDGNLSPIAKFPDRPPVDLSGMAAGDSRD